MNPYVTGMARTERMHHARTLAKVFRETFAKVAEAHSDLISFEVNVWRNEPMLMGVISDEDAKARGLEGGN